MRRCELCWYYRSKPQHCFWLQEEGQQELMSGRRGSPTLVIENLRAAVARSDWYDLELTAGIRRHASLEKCGVAEGFAEEWGEAADESGWKRRYWPERAQR
jgi:hypothetical protein